MKMIDLLNKDRARIKMNELVKAKKSLIDEIARLNKSLKDKKDQIKKIEIELGYF